MSRRRKRKKPRHGARGLKVRFDHLEIARGHDGLLRGRPDCAWVFGLYRGAAEGLVLVARGHVEVSPTTGTFPCHDTLEEDVLEAELPYTDQDRFLLLAIAIERDSGDLVRLAYAQLQQPERYHVWNAEDDTPSPSTLAEVGAGPPTAPPGALRLRLMYDGRDLDTDTADASDEWVGASAIILDGQRRSQRTYRAHVVSPDDRNDWTAELMVRLV